MKLTITQPHRVVLPDGIDIDRVKKFLTFKDKSVRYDIKRLENSSWLAARYGEDYYQAKLNELKQQQYRCLLSDDGAELSTHAGLAEELGKFFNLPVENLVRYPSPVMIPWAKSPTHQMRPYQREALEKLLLAKHGGVEIGTGLGKSLIILYILKELGLPAVVMTPSVSIASQMYDLLKSAFGTKYVGLYGDGKKQFKKRFVVGIAQALTRLEPTDEAYGALADHQIFVSDESHLTPAATLEKVCMGLVAAAPYRFFFSATQMRNDGAELLLKGIIGPIVYHMTVKDGVEQGYLARPVFKMLRVPSYTTYTSDDPNAMDRRHLLINPKVIAKAASIANWAAEQNMSTLILIDEFEQAALLDRYLLHPREFAHGGLRSLTPRERSRKARNPDSVKDPKDFLPPKFHKSDVHDQVGRFNAGEFPILIGTSAIGLGTDVLPAKVLILIQKGTSEIKFRQSVGRGTRKIPGKNVCFVFDFDVVNVDIVHRHALERARIYESILGPVEYVDLVEKNYVQ